MEWFVLGLVLGPLFIGLLMLIFYFHTQTDEYQNPEEYANTGKSGERLVYLRLINHFPENQILRNVYIKKSDDKLTEIDLIFVTTIGIFVFEVKNYSGWIFGDEFSKNWTQTFPNGEKFSHYNPIVQNKNHINALKKSLSAFSSLRYFSIIVFCGDAQLKTIDMYDNNLGIVRLSFLIEYMQKIFSACDVVITDDELNLILNYLNPLSRPDESIVAQHLSQFKNNG